MMPSIQDLAYQHLLQQSTIKPRTKILDKKSDNIQIIYKIFRYIYLIKVNQERLFSILPLTICP
jgi:hypothetical protein